MKGYGRILASGALFLFGTAPEVLPQTGMGGFSMEYISEIQQGFNNNVSWMNLVTLGYGREVWKNGSVRAEAIGTFRINNRPVAGDLMTFSGIENDNMPVNLSFLGYTHRFGRAELFAGIRNLGEDYFTGEYTSVFINSQCGLYPTLAESFPAATYPLSAVCFHAEYSPAEWIVLKNSLYNGVPGKAFSGPVSSFCIRPKRDGVMNFTEVGFSPAGDLCGLYTIGVALHSGYEYRCADHEGRKERTPPGSVFWFSAEQPLFRSDLREYGLMVKFSSTLRSGRFCRRYFGAGAVIKGLATRGRDVLGINVDKAVFSNLSESTVEVTWRYEANGFLAVQPAFHHIKTGHRRYNIGMLRLTLSL